MLDPCRISIRGRYPEQKCLKPAITNSQILQEPSFWGIHVEFPGCFFLKHLARRMFELGIPHFSHLRKRLSWAVSPGGDPIRIETEILRNGRNPRSNPYDLGIGCFDHQSYIFYGGIWPGVLNIPPVLRDEGDT